MNDERRAYDRLPDIISHTHGTLAVFPFWRARDDPPHVATYHVVTFDGRIARGHSPADAFHHLVEQNTSESLVRQYLFDLLDAEFGYSYLLNFVLFGRG